jgi:hypothetical protein
MTTPDFSYDDPFADPAPAADASADDVVADVVVPRGGPVANGRREPIAPARPLPTWADPSAQDFGDGANEGEIDYSDLESLNRDLLRLRVRMNRIRRQMRQAGRGAIEAKLNYHRALRRALVQQSGGSAESRKASAELMCEELEADMVMRQQVADEYATLFRAIRDDIENAKTVAYNMRAIASLG